MRVSVPICVQQHVKHLRIWTYRVSSRGKWNGLHGVMSNLLRERRETKQCFVFCYSMPRIKQMCDSWFGWSVLKPVRRRQRSESHCLWRRQGWSCSQKTGGWFDPEQQTVPCIQADDDKHHSHSSYFCVNCISVRVCVSVWVCILYPFSFHWCLGWCPLTQSADCLSAHTRAHTDYKHVQTHIHTKHRGTFLNRQYRKNYIYELC